eukprot:CAMPEP_0202919326 /NCGR_PEP_ID=MMETSP1392-20130828/75573_1 /ASSEMBLY_ACC=CAM_ASM_000868 /TAXON_ID=225041 /ORGANISM="Chlamydomonas chlamydogama, Strain SAG 11-48b" /LENGTH=75 /DNA_ID=CAMNT_0049612657 /DNA_START=226 /DNA_END=453 /DNA_ORIENTATION=-
MERRMAGGRASETARTLLDFLGLVMMPGQLVMEWRCLRLRMGLADMGDDAGELGPVPTPVYTLSHISPAPSDTGV